MATPTNPGTLQTETFEGLLPSLVNVVVAINQEVAETAHLHKSQVVIAVSRLVIAIYRRTNESHSCYLE